MLTSADRGETWQWVCELAVGYSGDTDPAIAVTAGGNVLVALYDGVKRTTDHGCEWQVAPDLADRNTADVSVERDDPNRAVALVSHRRSIPGSTYVYALEVWRSLDAGGSWAPVGPVLDDRSLGLTLDSAPSDPSRLYERSDVEGLLECPAGTRTRDFCADSWPFTCELIGKCVPDAGATRDASFDDAGLIESPSVRGGCACALGQTTRSRRQGFWSVLIVLGVALRRRCVEACSARGAALVEECSRGVSDTSAPPSVE